MGSTMDFSFSCNVGAGKTCDTCRDNTAFPRRSGIPDSVRRTLMGRESDRHASQISKICNPTTCYEYSVEYFLVFAIAGREEFPTYKANQMGLIQKDYRTGLKSSEGVSYLSTIQNFKIFVSLRGVRTRKQFFSFFVRLVSDPTLPETIIKPFPNSPVNSGFFFKGRFIFLKKREVLESVIKPDGESARFLRLQKMLPVEMLKQMVSRDYSELRKGVRKLKI